MPNDFLEIISSLRLKGAAEEIVQRFVANLKYERGKDQYSATPMDCYISFATVIRELLLDRWLITQPFEYERNSKRVYYLSLEYLIGRSLGNSILNLDLESQSLNALKQMGFKMDLLQDLEWDAGLGNGGLGRLAACFLDSLSSLKIPAYGYGIRYEYGIFFQHIKDGQQTETPDNWLRYGSVWEIPRPQRLFPVHFGGSISEYTDENGHYHSNWKPTESVMAMAYDYLIPGYKNGYVNTLRLWSAKSTRDFDLQYFNEGDYVQAVADKNSSEVISKVLYPNDESVAGKELRLKQEYFFVSATLQDIMRRFAKRHKDWRDLPDFAAIQMNDTHPAIAVAELMRLLIDEKRLNWETAREITKGCLSYTNHTILPEALEKWPVDMFQRILPRHLQIIYEINHRYLYQLRLSGKADDMQLRRMSLIEEEPVKSVRMAHLAIVGSNSINGVSKLHTQILKNEVFKDFYLFHPDKFNNKTNGITPRRWLMLANPRLSKLLDESISESWRQDLSNLSKLNEFLEDSAFLDALSKVKQLNKEEFAKYQFEAFDVKIDPSFIFDFHAKRFHEYKRQLLNALHIIHLINTIRDGEAKELQPHVFFFAGKAAPGYYMSKLIIRFINALRNYVGRDEQLSKLLQVVFLPNYNVSLAQKIMPAAEVSQQISMAGMEASGTGNMKFALNGALTVGTLDGANIEIRDRVGKENFFLFGLNADGVRHLKQSGYHPYGLAHENISLRRIMEFISSGALDGAHPGLFQPILNSLLYQGDEYCLIADLPDYISSMKSLNQLYQNPQKWQQMSAANIANMGFFSSDRTILEYAKEVWKV